MWVDDMNKRHRELAQVRARIVEGLAEREPPEGSEHGGATGGIVHVALPRDVHARIKALGERMGDAGNIRAVTAVLLRHALDQVEPLFAEQAAPKMNNARRR